VPVAYQALVPPLASRTGLPKLVPGQSFNIAARRRYNRKQRRGLDFHSQPTQEPGPEIIEFNQPAWLLRVNPASENNEDTVRSRGGAADYVPIPTYNGRIDDEHAARWRGRANRWLALLCFLVYFNSEVLSGEELSNA
jgi:hypothetical protein